MIKQNGSWWKDDRIPGLIARKQVDGFLFGHGFAIPADFYPDFGEAGGGSLPAIGESRPVRLLHENGGVYATYEARLEHWRIAVPSGKSSLEIRYDSNKELKQFLLSVFSSTYLEVKEWAERLASQPARQDGGSAQSREYGPAGVYAAAAEARQAEAARRAAAGSRRIPPRGEAADRAAARSPFDTPDAYLPREERAEYLYLYRTDTPFTYRLELRPLGGQELRPAHFFVTETGAEYLVAPPPEDAGKPAEAGGPPVEPRPHIPDAGVRAAVGKISAYIRQRGFSFPDGLVEHLYLSLKTRPFVILAGISGTGKTQLARLFAEALGASTDNGQFALIPVRPDWSDPADLIGYRDLSGAFKPGPLTLALKEAARPENADKPYFIVLDEMNLARVEHYFSDVLSLMETRRRTVREPEEDGNGDRGVRNGPPPGEIATQPLLPESALEREEDRRAYGNLSISGNVYVIGTVNMDETTYPFSKKVLDRAGTIEFNHIDLMQLPRLRAEAEPEAGTLTADRHLLGGDYLQLVDAMRDYAKLIERTSEELAQINGMLEEIQAHVGFRVRDAVCFYLIYNERFGLMTRAEAFDNQLMQKILPRIQGSRFSVKRVLLDLLRHCLGGEAAKAFDWRELEDSAEPVYSGRRSRETLAAARYPQSARKIAYMLRRLDEDGFTSYWLS
ncbi:McrB family protein [Saccharibacillus alkalitolerans]|uniref:AAA domain-containing protein n=1 Tax=Saccharibacillus alkalitolerans TaxID=2705290 RepID=A0ABX0F704_9BACL|nr:AAA family ATPase [Saccharibacillus alkalitolerans]NGZ74966.1 AAA domain-containing protein [Saccharibacillus alkalitolerans]